MQCAKCQTTNPETARFCLNCGASLSVACPQCGTALPAGARFCFNCGREIAAPATPAVAAQPRPQPAGPAKPVGLQQFIPQGLLAKLEAARAGGTMLGERRVVTMLFCDVKGSTAAASNLDPEEWAEIINAAFEHMIRPVYTYEGTVARLMGDGILAFFGAPVAHEDDPQRAILAGLEIVDAVRGYRREAQQRWGIALDVRVGINTGLVVVGAVGSDLRMEYTALGDAINLAARMEQTARPGSVQVAGATYRLVAPLFDFETVEGLEVKGKSEPLTAYRVLGRKSQPGSLRGLAGLQAPLIGRGREMEGLQAAVAQVRGGSGQIVSVLGEAGLGKSRLVAELRDALASSPEGELQWLEGHSLSYETATPYVPFVQILSDCLGVRKERGDAETYAQLKARIEALLPQRGAQMAPFLATMLHIEPQGDDLERVKYLEPPSLRAQLFIHVAALIERLATERPLVLFIDDLHWIDPTSLELLESLLGLTDRVMLLVIAAFRPRRQEPSWGFHELAQRDFGHRYTALPLQPLDSDQARELVGSLLHIEDLPEQVRSLILARSEGNPFFVEEVIRSLLDAGLVVRDNGHWRATREIANIALPDTLVGVITARLDRLEETDRQIAQAAAVIGREFAYDVLADIYGRPDQLEAGLANLQRRDLVREKARLPQRVYLFKHVLTQEAAYSATLLSRRRDLHRRVAQALEIRDPERVADIARHFLEARQPTLALPYLLAAGDRAARAYSAAEAMGFYRQALLFKDLAGDLSLVRRTYEGLGKVQTFANQVAEALDTYQAMLAAAEAADDGPMQVSALNKLANVTALRMGLFEEGEQYLARSKQLADQHRDHAGIAELTIVRCMMSTAMADFDSVVQHMGEVIEIGRRLEASEFLSLGMDHVAGSQVFMTRFDDAWETAQEGLRIARQIGNREHEASLLTNAIPVCLARNGDLDAARAAALEGVQLADKIGSLYAQVYGKWFLAEIARWHGEYEQALDFGRRSLADAEPVESFMPFLVVQPLGALGSVYIEISDTLFEQAAEYHLRALKILESPIGAMGGGTAWADLGICALSVGNLDVAEQVLRKGLDYPTMFMRLERPRFLAGLAMLALARDRLDEAARLIGDAQCYAEERRMRYLYPQIALTAGRVAAARGDTAAALAQFTQAESTARSMQMRPIIWQAAAAAAEVLDREGRHGEAEVRRAVAQTAIDEIAGLFTDPTLVAAFLQSARSRIAVR